MRSITENDALNKWMKILKIRIVKKHSIREEEEYFCLLSIQLEQ